jgi:hypothetical protein
LQQLDRACPEECSCCNVTARILRGTNGLFTQSRTPVGPGSNPGQTIATPRLFCELLGGVRLGFLVVSPFRIANEFLLLLGAEAEPIPGMAWSWITFILFCTKHTVPDICENIRAIRHCASCVKRQIYASSCCTTTALFMKMGMYQKVHAIRSKRALLRCWTRTKRACSLWHSVDSTCRRLRRFLKKKILPTRFFSIRRTLPVHVGGIPDKNRIDSVHHSYVHFPPFS